MATQTQRDNGDLLAKLALRRHFLRGYHSDGPIDVMDCCAGEGVIWGILRQECAITSYWAIDLKRKPGRLKMDSLDVLRQGGWTQNVIDIDTYGSPWKHFLALLAAGVERPTTIFLTIGMARPGMALCNQLELDAIFDGWVSRRGWEFRTVGGFPVSRCLISAAYHIVLTRCLGYVKKYNLSIASAAEAETAWTKARYVGLHLVPNEAGPD